MKYLLTLLLFVLSTCVYAQTTTYILLRHAEKDTSTQGSTMMQADPPLSDKGIQRAASLPFKLTPYRIDSIYTTNFIRTKSTIAPLANERLLTPVIYDHKKLKEFAAYLLTLKGKTIVVAGHSNTTPAMANLLLKENKFQPLDESVYNKIFIVTVTNDKATAEVLEY